MDQQLDQNNQRAGERRAVETEVELRRGAFRHEVAMLDLSAAGCKTEIAEHLEVGERLFVTMPGLEPLEARVRWEDGWRAGMAFERSIHPAVFDHVAGRLG